MKRTYQSPAMTVVNIESERICQDSLKSNTGMKLYGSDAGTEKHARSRDVIDNEEDDNDSWDW